MLNKELYKEYLYEMLDKEVESGKSKFIVYPNGAIAGYIVDILKERFQISPCFAVDNGNFDGKNVLNLDQASGQNKDDYYYLICSDRRDIYKAIRKRIYDAIPREQIIDLFPSEQNEREKENTLKIL